MEFAIALAYNDPRDYPTLAAAAEQAGFGAIVVSDHLVHPERLATPYPYTRDGRPRWGAEAAWPDPWVAIGAMAAVTREIRFVSSVFVLGLRHPVLAAKTIGTAAVMSGGRVTLGVGAGWMREEFELVGQSFENRGRRLEEMLDVMRKLWTGETVSHRGEFFDMGHVSMRPAPDVRIPIYIGGVSDAALRRAARIGDGWASEIQTTEEVRAIAARLAEYRRDSLLAAEPLDLCVALRDAFTLEHYRRAAEVGVTYAITVPWLLLGGRTDDPAAKKCDAIRRFGDEVVAKLRCGL